MSLIYAVQRHHCHLLLSVDGMIDNGGMALFALAIALAEDGDSVAVAENAVADCLRDDGSSTAASPVCPRHGFRPASGRRSNTAG